MRYHGDHYIISARLVSLNVRGREVNDYASYFLCFLFPFNYRGIMAIVELLQYVSVNLLV